MEMTDFDGLVGKIYQVPLSDGATLALELIAVTVLKPRSVASFLELPFPLREQPFRLTFRGPTELRLPDQMIPMKDENGALLEINLSAFAQDPKGIYYDAYFS